MENLHVHSATGIFPDDWVKLSDEFARVTADLSDSERLLAAHILGEWTPMRRRCQSCAGWSYLIRDFGNGNSSDRLYRCRDGHDQSDETA